MKTRCACRNGNGRVAISGVPIDVLSPNEMLKHYDRFLACGETHVVHHLPAHPFVVARDDEDFAWSLSMADLNLADGMGVVWGARFLGAKGLRDRLYGPAAMLDVMRWGLVRRMRHSLVGGSAETIAALQSNLARRIPGLRVVGAYSPPMREVTHAGVEQDLRAIGTDADVLWVGLSTPKQQRWAELARQHRPAKIIATVGAAFDFHAGTKPQAPVWMQRAGLEWTFRLATEPRRLWRRYLIGNPRFVWAVLNQRMGAQR